MRELKLRYFIELASNIGAKSQTEAQAVERSQRAMQAAVDKTSGSVRGLDTAFARWGASQAAERQLGYMRRLAGGIDQVTAKTRAMVSLLQNAVPKAVAAGGAAAGAFYAGKALTDKPIDYSMQLAHMANTAFSDRDTKGRQAGKAELDSAIIKAVRYGGGSREQGAQTLDALIASGAVPIETAKKMLPSLMKASSASGADASAIGNIAIKAMQTFKISEDQIPEILDIAMKAGQAGGFELKDMAKWLPQMMAAGKLSGLQGIEGFRRIVSGAQASAITSGSKDEAGNNVVNLLAKINSQDTQKDFKKQGFDLTGRLMGAREKGVNSIDAFVGFVDEIAAKDPKYVALQKKLASATTKDEKTETTEALASLLEGNAVGKVIQDRQALMYLVAEMNNRGYVKDVMGKTRTGVSAIDSAQSLIQGESGYKAQQLANNRDIAMSQAMGEGGPLKAVLDGANWAAEKFPILTSAVVGTTAALGVFATALMAFGLLGGRSAGGLPGRGGPGGGLPRSGGSPGAFPKLDGVASSAGGATGAAAKAATGLKALGWIGSALALGSELFMTSDADIATLNNAEARRTGGAMRGKGYNDPRLLAATMPSIAEQAAAMGGPAPKVELGDGKIAVDVRVTDERTTATASVTTPMSGVKLSTGATKPEGTW
ncbi:MULTISPECIES: phage tail tape measure protein [unclassified Polaromonas]|jgi:hypothetical protein|uniref:phage tail tape measure protein n=1 Tax=unclassified Polaromonas TaxID=2638319 RepID=UPI000BC94A28|nr:MULTISPECIES: phage tail tape measure protein [unclassified Polaromonas]OYZ76093.1 MAG: hypothetical protein B7Y09_21950 [Polaromonas sp. 24-63-21]OZA47380.1 MAG: hypothetical protein B7X88_22415 [Polaromonas sp. 17-63-33]